MLNEEQYWPVYKVLRPDGEITKVYTKIPLPSVEECMLHFKTSMELGINIQEAYIYYVDESLEKPKITLTAEELHKKFFL